MDGKLRQLMKHEGVNSTRLAEILGIQASGISHIMSGRNKPSFDFLLKLLQRFPQISPDWLLLDKGPMYRDEIKNKGGQTGSVRPDGTSNMGGTGNTGGAADIARQGGAIGAVGDVGTAYHAGSTDAAVGMGGVDGLRGTGVMAGTGNIGGTGGRGAASGGFPGELFGPDNKDIIPLGGYPEQVRHTGMGAEPRLNSNQGQNQTPGAHPSGPTGLQPGYHPVEQAGQFAGQHTMQHSMYQAGGFLRSASIERIVVFYKDKTFSEYQPE